MGAGRCRHGFASGGLAAAAVRLVLLGVAICPAGGAGPASTDDHEVCCSSCRVFACVCARAGASGRWGRGAGKRPWVYEHMRAM